MKIKDQTLTSTTIDDCAKHCTDEIGIKCNAFQFCFITAECVISKDYLVDDDNEYMQDSYCDIYESEFFSRR
jgi:hypothetical protein